MEFNSASKGVQSTRSSILSNWRLSVGLFPRKASAKSICPELLCTISPPIARGNFTTIERSYATVSLWRCCSMRFFHLSCFSSDVEFGINALLVFENHHSACIYQTPTDGFISRLLAHHVFCFIRDDLVLRVEHKLPSAFHAAMVLIAMAIETVFHKSRRVTGWTTGMHTMTSVRTRSRGYGGYLVLIQRRVGRVPFQRAHKIPASSTQRHFLLAA